VDYNAVADNMGRSSSV